MGPDMEETEEIRTQFFVASLELVIISSILGSKTIIFCTPEIEE
jgi:hypothetical protein